MVKQYKLNIQVKEKIVNKKLKKNSPLRMQLSMEAIICSVIILPEMALIIFWKRNLQG